MIGKGGFGVVYKCLDVATGECVAIKSITSKNISKAKLKDLQANYLLFNKIFINYSFCTGGNKSFKAT
jgi:serine/threonine protein kinase